jgi:RNA polymerase sigma-70 factor (ECF subfamily)
MGDGETLVLSPESALPTGVDVAQVFAGSYRKLVVQMYGIVGNAGEAEDLVQEAFVRAYAAGPRFTRVDNPEAWLRTTALNLHRNRWRKMRNFTRIRHRLHETPDLQGLDAHVEVVDALRQLPENQREVLVLHYFADRQVQQIAEELGVAEGTVKSRLARGREALAGILKEDIR